MVRASVSRLNTGALQSVIRPVGGPAGAVQPVGVWRYPRCAATVLSCAADRPEVSVLSRLPPYDRQRPDVPIRWLF